MISFVPPPRKLQMCISAKFLTHSYGKNNFLCLLDPPTNTKDYILTDNYVYYLVVVCLGVFLETIVHFVDFCMKLDLARLL